MNETLKDFKNLYERVQMWHEARKQEKALAIMFSDRKKKIERKRQHYEKFLSDPVEMIRVFGIKILFENTDNNTMLNAHKNLVPYNGDFNNLVDRFDARILLDYSEYEANINENVSIKKQTFENELNYERYKYLIKLESSAVNEVTFLRSCIPEKILCKTDRPKFDKEVKRHSSINFHYDKTYNNIEINDTNVYNETASSNSSISLDECNHGETDNSENEPQHSLLEFNIDNDLQNINKISSEYGLSKGEFQKKLLEEVQDNERIKLIKVQETELSKITGRKAKKHRQLLRGQYKQDSSKSSTLERLSTRKSPQYEEYRCKSSLKNIKNDKRSYLHKNTRSSPPIEYISEFDQNDLSKSTKTSPSLDHVKKHDVDSLTKCKRSRFSSPEKNKILEQKPMSAKEKMKIRMQMMLNKTHFEDKKQELLKKEQKAKEEKDRQKEIIEIRSSFRMY